MTKMKLFVFLFLCLLPFSAALVQEEMNVVVKPMVKLDLVNDKEEEEEAPTNVRQELSKLIRLLGDNDDYKCWRKAGWCSSSAISEYYSSNDKDHKNTPWWHKRHLRGSQQKD